MGGALSVPVSPSAVKGSDASPPAAQKVSLSDAPEIVAHVTTVAQDAKNTYDTYESVVQVSLTASVAIVSAVNGGEKLLSVCRRSGSAELVKRALNISSIFPPVSGPVVELLKTVYEIALVAAENSEKCEMLVETLEFVLRWMAAIAEEKPAARDAGAMEAIGGCDHTDSGSD